MYRSCIFCSGRLGSNDSIEHFPVGRTLAFDAAKGRLWAVCPKCARWNLAPIEERWEAIEEAETQFRDTRLRAQSENVGLAKLRDGTRLVRIGAALKGELAVWRYGAQLQRRRRKYLWSAGLVTTGLAVATGGVVAGVWGTGVLMQIAWYSWDRSIFAPPVHHFSYGEFAGISISLPDLKEAKLVRAGLEAGLGLRFPGLAVPLLIPFAGAKKPATLTGSVAASVLRRGMVRLNAAGAGERKVQGALELLAPGGAAGYLETLVARREPLWDPFVGERERNVRLLALEMALHEESERKAMEGELAELEAAWRQAEEIAAIADALPGRAEA